MSNMLKIGFLGGGKMAQAMAKGFISAGKMLDNTVQIKLEYLCNSTVSSRSM